MPSHVLPRSGRLPLRIDGELLAESTSHAPNGPRNTRWHELRLFRAPDGHLYLAVGLRTHWRDETGRDDVYDGATAADLSRALDGFAPLPDGYGFPMRADFAEKRAALERTLRAGWERALAEVLSAAGLYVTPDEDMADRHTEAQDMERYGMLLDDAERRCAWTPAERSLFVDALRHADFDAWSDVPEHVEDAIRTQGLDEVHGVDAAPFMRKLLALDLCQIVATVDAAERAWQDLAAAGARR